MPQAQTFTIVDGASPAANHTFSPSSVSGALSVFYADNGSVKLANREKLTVSVRPATSSAPAKIVVKLDLPTQGVDAAGAVKRVESNLFALDALVSQDSTEEGRKARRVLLANFLLSPEFAAVHDKVEAFL